MQERERHTPGNILSFSRDGFCLFSIDRVGLTVLYFALLIFSLSLSLSLFSHPKVVSSYGNVSN